ncbi:anti-sigma factor family protein [Wukongibacter sp. M2B1]|uniref:anti-sigma factor family protein n=1 Tax=Wukongibacter sp. M2B1 TaxID=3088895 RepID=UPI003D79A9D4
MECREAIEKIDKYYENQLNDIEVYKIERHLEECSECNKEYEEMRVIFDMLSDHSIVLPPKDFTNTIMNKIMVQIRPNKRRPMIMKKWGVSFVAAGLLIFILNTSLGFSIDDISNYLYNGSFTRNSGISKYIKEIHTTFNNNYRKINIGGLRLFKNIKLEK